MTDVREEAGLQSSRFERGVARRTELGLVLFAIGDVAKDDACEQRFAVDDVRTQRSLDDDLAAIGGDECRLDALRLAAFECVRERDAKRIERFGIDGASDWCVSFEAESIDGRRVRVQQPAVGSDAHHEVVGLLEKFAEARFAFFEHFLLRLALALDRQFMHDVAAEKAEDLHLMCGEHSRRAIDDGERAGERAVRQDQRDGGDEADVRRVRDQRMRCEARIE